MQPAEKKRVFLYAGIGFVAVGVMSIILIYMFVYQPTTTTDNEAASGGENQEFDLEVIHRVPLARHDHVSMSILVNGRPAVIPKEVGMNPDLWHDHSLDRYGPSGISPLHTHDTSGTIHIESTTEREFTIGEFMSVMGIDSENVSRVVVNGDEVDGNPLNHEMKKGEQIQVELTIAS